MSWCIYVNYVVGKAFPSLDSSQGGGNESLMTKAKGN